MQNLKHESYEAGRLYGVGLYPKISDQDKTLVAFGMTNQTLINQAETDILGATPELDRAEVLRGVSVGLMQAAGRAGKMIA